MKYANILLASFLPIFGGCSTKSEPILQAPPPEYVGIPASLMPPCIVHDVPNIATNGDLYESRGRYKKGFQKCAATVDAIRKHDAEARAAVGQ